jgi:hypothetical protein
MSTVQVMPVGRRDWSQLQLPVFFFIGRHDHVVPMETSVAYLDKLILDDRRGLQRSREPWIVWYEDLDERIHRSRGFRLDSREGSRLEGLRR